MKHYKDLNKELVEQVQSMKILLNDYQTEIISLKAQMRQQYENNLFLKKRCFYMAVKNCKDLIEFLEPDSSLLTNLQQFDENPQDDNQSTKRTSRIAEISEEIRRSNNIIHSRQSLNSLSPLRSRSTDDESDADTVVEIENTTASAQTPRTTTNVIYEEDEDQCNTEIVDELENSVHEDESHIETLDELEISETHKDMNTITTITTVDGEQEEDVITENINKFELMSLEENNESSIQVRELRGNRYTSNESIILPSMTSGGEDSMQFSKAMASSTPNSKSNSRQKLVVDESKSIPSTSTLTRPSRNCKPKSFKELPINAKQRNDSTEKSLGCNKKNKSHK